VLLKIFGIQGGEACRLESAVPPAEPHSAVFDGSGFDLDDDVNRIRFK
jgi:hypothetical protein